MSLLQLDRIGRTYDMGPQVVHALRDVSMTVETGEFVAILGPSDRKSTRLNSSHIQKSRMPSSA